MALSDHYHGDLQTHTQLFFFRESESIQLGNTHHSHYVEATVVVIVAIVIAYTMCGSPMQKTNIILSYFFLVYMIVTLLWNLPESSNLG